MRKSLIQPSVTIPDLFGLLLDAGPEYRIPRQRAGVTRRKPARRTVGSISVPELPGYWPGRDGPRDACPCSCPTCGHESGSLDYCDQVDCDCVDPFHCI